MLVFVLARFCFVVSAEARTCSFRSESAPACPGWEDHSGLMRIPLGQSFVLRQKTIPQGQKIEEKSFA